MARSMRAGTKKARRMGTGDGSGQMAITIQDSSRTARGMESELISGPRANALKATGRTTRPTGPASYFIRTEQCMPVTGRTI